MNIAPYLKNLEIHSPPIIQSGLLNLLYPYHRVPSPTLALSSTFAIHFFHSITFLATDFTAFYFSTLPLSQSLTFIWHPQVTPTSHSLSFSYWYAYPFFLTYSCIYFASHSLTFHLFLFDTSYIYLCFFLLLLQIIKHAQMHMHPSPHTHTEDYKPSQKHYKMPAIEDGKVWYKEYLTTIFNMSSDPIHGQLLGYH